LIDEAMMQAGLGYGLIKGFTSFLSVKHPKGQNIEVLFKYSNGKGI